MLIDTHAHLDSGRFADELDDVIGRAADAGVDRIVTIGTDAASSRQALEIADRFENVYAAVGVHPTSDLEAEEDGMIDLLREWIRHPKALAIGEIGLDYFRLPKPLDSEANQSVIDRQKRVFRAQLDLASETGMNVVIHQRSAWEDVLEAVNPYTGKLKAVFHCFSEEFERAREVISLGHLVSFTGIVTFKNATGLQDCASRVPGDAFMVETDAPYLAPEPHRGKRCEPAHTRLTAESIARLRRVPLTDLAASTTRNAEAFFNIPRSEGS